MGIMLTAKVEFRPTPRDLWWRVATFDIGKAYTLMARLHEQATRDWPADVHDRDAPQNDFPRYWMDGNTVVVGVTEQPIVWLALNACLHPLVGAGQTRVLYLEI